MTQRRQLLYTVVDASQQGRSGASGGWQVKQASEGLTEDERQAALGMVVSDIAPVHPLSEFPGHDEIARRPVRLAYRLVEGNGCWCRSVPAGADVTGRPGNVFNHVVIEPGPLDAVAPAALERPVEVWEAPQWLAPFGAAQVQTSAFDPDDPPRSGGVLGLEDVLAFLLDEDTERLSVLPVLLDAVLESIGGGRPTVLGADVDDGARWIAVVSQLMSPQLARTLSFSTFERLRAVPGSPFPSHVVVVPPEDLDQSVPDEVIVLDPRSDAVADDAAAEWVTLHGQRITRSSWGALAMDLCVEDADVVARTLRRRDSLAGELSPAAVKDPVATLAIAMAADDAFSLSTELIVHGLEGSGIPDEDLPDHILGLVRSAREERYGSSAAAAASDLRRRRRHGDLAWATQDAFRRFLDCVGRDVDWLTGPDGGWLPDDFEMASETRELALEWSRGAIELASTADADAVVAGGAVVDAVRRLRLVDLAMGVEDLCQVELGARPAAVEAVRGPVRVLSTTADGASRSLGGLRKRTQWCCLWPAVDEELVRGRRLSGTQLPGSLYELLVDGRPLESNRPPADLMVLPLYCELALYLRATDSPLQPSPPGSLLPLLVSANKRLDPTLTHGASLDRSLSQLEGACPPERSVTADDLMTLVAVQGDDFDDLSVQVLLTWMVRTPQDVSPLAAELAPVVHRLAGDAGVVGDVIPWDPLAERLAQIEAVVRCLARTPRGWASGGRADEAAVDVVGLLRHEWGRLPAAEREALVSARVLALALITVETWSSAAPDVRTTTVRRLIREDVLAADVETALPDLVDELVTRSADDELLARLAAGYAREAVLHRSRGDTVLTVPLGPSDVLDGRSRPVDAATVLLTAAATARGPERSRDLMRSAAARLGVDEQKAHRDDVKRFEEWWRSTIDSSSETRQPTWWRLRGEPST